jgi:NADH:quinone reductase (non-electrogenic)
MQMARHVAKIINDELSRNNSPRATFKYFDKGTMATIGRSKAVALIGKIRLHGFVAWMAWLLVHLIFLIGFRSKITVMIQWIYSYFLFKRGARIITENPAKTAA